MLLEWAETQQIHLSVGWRTFERRPPAILFFFKLFLVPAAKLINQNPLHKLHRQTIQMCQYIYMKKKPEIF